LIATRKNHVQDNKQVVKNEVVVYRMWAYCCLL